MLPLAEPPRTVCILRLSAIGDTCHVVPVLRTLQQAWPATRFTWIIGRLESRLMRLIEEVEFIIVDKRAGVGRGQRCAAALPGGISMCCCTCSWRCAPACSRAGARHREARI